MKESLPKESLLKGDLPIADFRSIPHFSDCDVAISVSV